VREAEGPLEAAQARYERDLAAWRLEVAALRESAAADRRLAEHAVALHASARAELAELHRELEVAQRESRREQPARDQTMEDIDLGRELARHRNPSDHSEVRMSMMCVRQREDDEDEDDAPETMRCDSAG